MRLSELGQRPMGVAASMVLGPLIMSVGDLLHPAEAHDPVEQATIIVASASNWYLAHLLLFIGFLLFVPGVLAFTEWAARYRYRSAYIARILLLIGMASFSAIFVFEMLIGRFVIEGADTASAALLLSAFTSVKVLGVVILGGLGFFAGVAVLLVVFWIDKTPYRWPASVLAIGTVFVLAEIITANVLLSQVGNVLIFVAGVMFAVRGLELEKTTANI